jgi:hypothetical protein
MHRNGLANGAPVSDPARADFIRFTLDGDGKILFAISPSHA